MVDENGNWECDYCGKDDGEFNTETGNHVICERLAALEKIAEEMAARIEAMRTYQNVCRDLPGLLSADSVYLEDDAAALAAYEEWKKNEHSL